MEWLSKMTIWDTKSYNFDAFVKKAVEKAATCLNALVQWTMKTGDKAYIITFKEAFKLVGHKLWAIIGHSLHGTLMFCQYLLSRHLIMYCVVAFVKQYACTSREK